MKATFRFPGTRLLILWAFSILVFPFSTARAQTPPLINFQGRVAVGGVPFNGVGQFEFALVSSNGATTYWSNDGTSVDGSEPAAYVSLALANGLYSVLLGDTTLTNMTQTISPDIFTNADVYLRVWFNDGANGFAPLLPDQRLAATPYAMFAQTAGTVSGTVAAAQISGALSPGQLSASVITNGASGVTIAGAFTGNGDGLTNLNAAHITGSIPAAQLPSTVVTNNESGVTLSNVNVNGDAQITGGVTLDAAAADAGVIGADTSLLFGGSASGEGIGSQRVTDGPAKQYSLDFYTSSSQRMTILLNGNVGIGTNTPGALLDVAGSVHATGNIATDSGFTGDGSGLTNTVTTGNYLFAYTTEAPFINTADTFQPIMLSQRAAINNWTYGESTGSFTNAQTGLYLFQYTVVAEETYGSTPQVSVIAQVNGTEIRGSLTTTTLAIVANPFALSHSFIASLNSGDVVQLEWTANNTQVVLQNIGDGTTRPGATLTITRLQ
jgi:hypothetical protein